MLRKELEVNDKNKVKEILDKSQTLRLGLNDTYYPYIVPVSYGYTFKKDKLELYIHGAFKGKKHQLIEKNNNVCVETDYINDYKLTKDSATVEYGSIIAYGIIGEIKEKENKIYAMEKIITHCNMQFEINEKLLEKTKIYKIEINKLTAKTNIK